ncbi:peptidase M24, structural domain-containing protein [Radiomyces spectabilis]|uniref:peptidase M24, structural domain-containing protein n=1 Tax=Radiomyces spectabilis TaxID=64574 RepID=UPI0022206CBF|nr:peptidase M24, structural domain-containing protein [Radiomyces spectabilis]KAI8372777.1 peptidase M24, structural domain-containing protein [Radiomyces spectabilis]
MAQKFPTRENVKKILQNFGVSEGVIYLNGQVLHERDDTDVEYPFRQESNFFYVTGVPEPDFHVVIDLATQQVELYAPNINPDHVMWMGMPDSLETLRAKYDIDEAFYVDKLNERLSKASTVYTLPIADRKLLEESKASVADADKNKALYTAFVEARCVKADWEVEVIRQANKISSDAHVKLMQTVKQGMNEQELYALFLYESVRHGALFQSYYPIVGVGMNAATLHYNKNNAVMKEATDMVLVDAGAEYRCYASDITRAFPVGGKFSEEAKVIYSIVLDMQKACLAKCKAGVAWEDIHNTATEVACDGLLKAGILVGSKQDILANHVVAAFFPHGVGHMLGLDVHDVGGYPEGVERIDAPGIRNLRMRRTLAKGHVVTVEPGVYFCDFLIDPVLKAAETGKYINQDMLNKYKSVGGVRIEDNILITEDGHINLTTAPKEIAEIEALMAAGADQESKKRKLEA